MFSYGVDKRSNVIACSYTRQESLTRLEKHFSRQCKAEDVRRIVLVQYQRSNATGKRRLANLNIGPLCCLIAAVIGKCVGSCGSSAFRAGPPP